jgi:hypothetical protein
MLDQALDWLFDKVHGLGFAVAILAALLAWAAAKNDPDPQPLLPRSVDIREMNEATIS